MDLQKIGVCFFTIAPVILLNVLTRLSFLHIRSNKKGGRKLKKKYKENYAFSERFLLLPLLNKKSHYVYRIFFFMNYILIITMIITLFMLFLRENIFAVSFIIHAFVSVISISYVMSDAYFASK